MITACSEKVSRGLVVWSSNNKCQIFFCLSWLLFYLGWDFGNAGMCRFGGIPALLY